VAAVALRAAEAAKRRARLVEDASYLVTESRLQLMEAADGEVRETAWAALRDEVARSEMVAVAFGLKVRARPPHLHPVSHPHPHPVLHAYASHAYGYSTSHPTAARSALNTSLDPAHLDHRRRESHRPIPPTSSPSRRRPPVLPALGEPSASLSARPRLPPSRPAPRHTPLPPRPFSARSIAEGPPSAGAALSPRPASSPSRRGIHGGMLHQPNQPQPPDPQSAPRPPGPSPRARPSSARSEAQQGARAHARAQSHVIHGRTDRA